MNNIARIFPPVINYCRYHWPKPGLVWSEPGRLQSGAGLKMVAASGLG